MTICIAYHRPGYGTVIGTDSVLVKDDEWFLKSAGKWILGENGALMSCGLTRHGNVLLQEKGYLFHDYDALNIASRIGEILTKASYKPRYHQDTGYPLYDGEWLYATPTSVYSIGRDLAVIPSASNSLRAIGNGAPYALGCYTYLRNSDNIDSMTPEEVVHSCLEACEISIYCGGPSHILTLKE